MYPTDESMVRKRNLSEGKLRSSSFFAESNLKRTSIPLAEEGDSDYLLILP